MSGRSANGGRSSLQAPNNTRPARRPSDEELTPSPHLSSKQGPSPLTNNGAAHKGKNIVDKPSSNSGESVRTSSNAIPDHQGSIKCPHCDRGYVTRSGLAKHLKTCGVRSRNQCQYCSAPFNTFQGVRQHEKKAHSESYYKDLESQLPVAESVQLFQMAQIEARATKGSPFLVEMANVTGLTKDQIKYKRSKEIYQQYLLDARKDLSKITPFTPKGVLQPSKGHKRNRSPQSPSSPTHPGNNRAAKRRDIINIEVPAVDESDVRAGDLPDSVTATVLNSSATASSRKRERSPSPTTDEPDSSRPRTDPLETPCLSAASPRLKMSPRSRI